MSKSSNRPVRVRFTRDGAWPKTAEVVISSPDKVPAEAKILHYEDGDPYEDPQRRKAAKRTSAGAAPTGDRAEAKRARDAAAKRAKRAAAAAERRTDTGPASTVDTGTLPPVEPGA